MLLTNQEPRLVSSEGSATTLKSRTLKLKSSSKSWNLARNPEILLEIQKSDVKSEVWNLEIYMPVSAYYRTFP